MARVNRKLLAVLVLGVIAGVLLALTAEQVDHWTSTDEFCTSCHAMSAYVAESEVFQQSAHRSATHGVNATCADCHIPKGLVMATYTHIVDGTSDLIGEFMHDYEDPAIWQQERARLAYAVRDKMRASDSVTCRSCHQEARIQPARQRGKKQHEFAKANAMTCIDCHYNLVHDPVEPLDSFLDSAGSPP